jgi:hypothetical protein
MKGIVSPAIAVNLAPAVIVAVPALVASNYWLFAFTVLCYGLWCAAKAANLWFGSKRYQPLHTPSATFDKSTYKRFALYIRRPSLALVFSTTLHWLRIGSFAWIAMSLWQGLYIVSIALVLFCILSSGTIATMFPDLYFEDAAKRGNRGAAEMLRDLRHVQNILSLND